MSTVKLFINWTLTRMGSILLMDLNSLLESYTPKKHFWNTGQMEMPRLQPWWGLAWMGSMSTLDYREQVVSGWNNSWTLYLPVRRRPSSHMALAIRTRPWQVCKTKPCRLFCRTQTKPRRTTCLRSTKISKWPMRLHVEWAIRSLIKRQAKWACSTTIYTT